MKKSLKRAVETALRATGLQWSIEPGKKHNKVYLADRFIGILPHGVQGQSEVHDKFWKQIDRRVSEVNGQAK